MHSYSSLYWQCQKRKLCGVTTSFYLSYRIYLKFSFSCTMDFVSYEKNFFFSVIVFKKGNFIDDFDKLALIYFMNLVFIEKSEWEGGTEPGNRPGKLASGDLRSLHDCMICSHGHMAGRARKWV